jgi:hypothetical protein
VSNFEICRLGRMLKIAPPIEQMGHGDPRSHRKFPAARSTRDAFVACFNGDGRFLSLCLPAPAAIFCKLPFRPGSPGLDSLLRRCSEVAAASYQQRLAGG